MMRSKRLIHGFEICMAGRSDIGRVRSNNEDYLDWDLERGLAVLADGIGGSNAGEVASRMAVSTLLEQLPHYPDSVVSCQRQFNEAIEQANRRIYMSAQYAPFLGMGTTLAALWICDQQVLLAHVGDSRIYHLHEGELAQLTVDHSLVQEMVDSGVLTRNEALHSSRRHIITRALGLDAAVAADIQLRTLHGGDRYLLCSDGLSDMVDTATLAALLQDEGLTLEEQVEGMIEQANIGGGQDNISALVVAIERADAADSDN